MDNNIIATYFTRFTLVFKFLIQIKLMKEISILIIRNVNHEETLPPLS